MKKILALAMVLGVLGSVIGCGSGSSEDSTATAGAATAGASTAGAATAGSTAGADTKTE